MGRWLLGSLVLGLLAVTGTAKEEASDVELLTAKTFDDFIKKHPVSLVKFMAPWCGHCKKLAPEYEAAAKELKSDNIPLAEVDATNDQQLAEKYKVQGFPTMYLFRNGEPEPYNGGRTKQTIVDWVKKMTGPAVSWMDGKDAAVKAAAEQPVAFVGAFKGQSTDAAKAFESVGDKLRSKGKFIGYANSALEKESVTVMRQGEDDTPAPSLEKDALAKFVEDESIPLFGLIGGDNYATYAQRTSNWMWVAAQKADFEKLGPQIRKVSKNYRTEMNFVWLDIDQHKPHAEQALGLTEFPSIAVVYEDIKYHYPEDMAALSEKSLVKFLQNIKAGKATKFFKSEPVPEKNDGPVKDVVGSNFAEMVLQKDKDVLLKIYAPWCGHCKKLVPVYEELAEKLKGNDHLLIAKIDGTANEITVPDFQFQGFPTLYFVKAGSKKPMPYDGGRKVEDFIAFLKKESTKPITVAGETSEGDKDEL